MTVISRFFDGLKYEGVKSTAWRSAKWLSTRLRRFDAAPLSSVFPQDVVAVDWTKPRTFVAQPLVSASKRPQIGWIISPPNRAGGGHINAYRFMEYLEAAGYDITIFLYSAHKYPKISLDGTRHMIASTSGYPQLRAEYRLYDAEAGVTGDFDVIVATDWQTAYAAWRYDRDVPRVYWTQDFEPLFYPAGADSLVAENSYRLGYHGITNGPWLSDKVTKDFGMTADFYDYAADSTRYARTNDEWRSEIVFYARPSTPRRATEFGFLILQDVAERRPDIVINVVGADASRLGLKFPFVNHGSMRVADLPNLYNRCAVGLMFSMTSSSLLPLEVMACGAVPITNDGEQTRVALRDNSNVEFLPAAPSLIADHIIAAVDRPDQVEHSRRIAQTMVGTSWEASGQRVVDIFDRLVRARPSR